MISRHGFRFLSDAPGDEGDLWEGLKSLGHRLAEIVPGLPKDSPILLSGPWGSGKTTLMRTVRRRLESDLLLDGEEWSEDQDFQRSVWFEAWRYEGEVALLPALVRTVWQALPGKEDEEVREKTREFYHRAWTFAGRVALKYAPDVLRATGLPFSSVVADQFGTIHETYRELAPGRPDLEKLFGVPDADPSEQLWKSFSNLLAAGWKDRLPVIFIDDLDRCSPAGAVALLDGVRMLVSQAGELPCRFILAIDRQVMANAITQKFAGIGQYDGNRYLEKIFPISFELPEPRRREAEKLVRRFLVADREIRDLEADDRDALTQALSEPIFANPRLMKRCINRFRLTLFFELTDEGTEVSADSPGRKESHRNRALAKWIAATERWPTLRTLLGQHGDPYWREAATALTEKKPLDDHDFERLLEQRGVRGWLRREMLPGKVLRTDQFRDADRRLRRWGL